MHSKENLDHRDIFDIINNRKFNLLLKVNRFCINN
jgi:hypothetical protein